MAKILIADDDAESLDVLRSWLLAERHSVDSLTDGSEVLERLEHFHYDIAVLDWNMPVMTGVDICRSYREKGGSVPIIMLTGRSLGDEKAHALDCGADDYLTKPFHPKELSARIRSVMRRPSQAVKPVMELDGLSLNTNNRTIKFQGLEVELLPKEYAILEFLFRHPDTYFSANAIVERVYSSESESSPDAIRVHIARLRDRLAKVGAKDRIVTMHGFGYKLISKPL